MKVNEMKEMSFEREDLNALPNSFEGVYKDEELRKDAREKDCLFVSIEMPNGGEIIQKYSQMHLAELVKAVELLGYSDSKDMIGKKFVWEKKFFRIGNSRWIPIKKV